MRNCNASNAIPRLRVIRDTLYAILILMDISTIILYMCFFVTLYFEIFLFVTLFEHWHTRSLNNAPSIPKAHAPRVAIIVPAHNEGNTIGGTLDSLRALSYPKDKLEVIVVDDGSSDNTAAVATRYTSDPRIRLIQKENGGKHTALNEGIAHTDAEIVGCLDADSFVAPDALTHLIQVFEDASVQAVTPAIRLQRAHTLAEIIQKVEYEVAIFLRKVFSLLNAQYVTPGPFSLYRRSIFAEVGDFKRAYNTEDMEIAIRIRAAGYKIENVSEALVHTTPPRTFFGLYKQRLRWVSGFLSNVVWEYRHLVFRKKYGHLGMFSLPFALISLVTAIYLTGYMLFSLTTSAFNTFATWQAVNFDASWLIPSFDLYTFSIGTTTIIAVILVLGVAALIVCGRAFVREKKLVSFDMIPFLVLYGFIAPVWIATSMYHTAFPRQRKWRK